MKTLNRREIEKMLKKNGWEFCRQSGGHVIYKKENDTLAIGICNCNKMITQRLIKTYNMVL